MLKFWLNNKDLRMIIALFIFILKITNLLKSLLFLINVIEKDKIINKSIFIGMIKYFCLNFKSLKILKN